MCGICGAVWTDPASALNMEELRAMMSRLVHRGPDDSGEYRDNHAALGFRRLSIIDLAGRTSASRQRGWSVWTVFNGEIYNFPCTETPAGSKRTSSSLDRRYRDPCSSLRR